MTSLDELKTKGNEYFAQNNFIEAEKYYREALIIDNNSHTILTNLAAALIRQNRFEEAIELSDRAISIDSTWVKAYFRKATALESLGKHREAFSTWNDALKNVPKNATLDKQFQQAKAKWIKFIRTEPIISEDDFISRYKLLIDPREKLSTLAHFWNCSNQQERYSHFTRFLSMIGGEGELSEETKAIEVEMMMAMPMNNYEDLSIDKIQLWVDFFNALDSSGKTGLLEKVWNLLTSQEQTAVVLDLKQFVAQSALRMQQLKEEHK
jgi:hypothetical protein